MKNRCFKSVLKTSQKKEFCTKAKPSIVFEVLCSFVTLKFKNWKNLICSCLVHWQTCWILNFRFKTARWLVQIVFFLNDKKSLCLTLGVHCGWACDQIQNDNVHVSKEYKMFWLKIIHRCSSLNLNVTLSLIEGLYM